MVSQPRDTRSPVSNGADLVFGGAHPAPTREPFVTAGASATDSTKETPCSYPPPEVP